MARFGRELKWVASAGGISGWHQSDEASFVRHMGVPLHTLQRRAKAAEPPYA